MEVNPHSICHKDKGLGTEILQGSRYLWKRNEYGG